jgi:glycosyltransferase involved in cell wall biosynthesis
LIQLNKLPEPIFFVHQQPHPAHGIWAEKVGAKFIYFKGHRFLRERSNWNHLLKFFRASLPWRLSNLIISEGGAPLNTSVILHNYSGAPIVMILADETGLRVRNTDDKYSRDIRAYLKLVDGAISVSELVTDSFKDLFRDNIPIETVRPSVGSCFLNADMKELHGEPFRIALVAKGGSRGLTGKIPDWFGDLSVSLQEKMPDLEILIAGTDELHVKTGNVMPVGSIPYNRMVEFYQSINLLLHIPDFDSFPVVPAESLACGTPALVSRGAGICEFFDEHELKYLTIDDTSIDSLSQQIIDALRNPPDKKERQLCRRLIEDNLAPGVSAANFKSALERICSKIR